MLAESVPRMRGCSTNEYVGAVPRTARNFWRVHGNAPYINVIRISLPLPSPLKSKWYMIE
jgi:hypothetical protein